MVVPGNVDDAFRLATAVVGGNMAPESFKGNREGVMIAMLHGMELGLSPMQAIQSIAVINGRPSIWGDALLALVMNSPYYEDHDERMDGTGNERVATCEVWRTGKKKSVVRQFSWEEAKLAGLTNKKGPWQQYPTRMLQLRARAFALRDAFPDVLSGCAVAEEQQDVIDITPSQQGPQSTAEPAKAPVDPPARPARDQAPEGPPAEAPRKKADRTRGAEPYAQQGQPADQTDMLGSALDAEIVGEEAPAGSEWEGDERPIDEVLQEFRVACKNGFHEGGNEGVDRALASFLTHPSADEDAKAKMQNIAAEFKE